MAVPLRVRLSSGLRIVMAACSRRSRWEKDGAVVRISVLFQPMVCEDFRECNQTHLQCLLTLMTLDWVECRESV